MQLGRSLHTGRAAGQPLVSRNGVHTRPARRVKRPSAEGEEPQPVKLGPDVATGIKEVKEGLRWSTATVIRNEAANLEGNYRVIHLSVADHIDMLYGRKVEAMPAGTRWMDSYTMPGQCVGLRMPGEAAGTSGAPQRLYSISNSPYESRRDSAYIDASIVEVVVDKRDGSQDAQLAALEPGSVIEASQVVGRGFSSLFNSYVGLPSALEEGRPVLAVAVGLKGIAPVRAMLNWAPIQAHATAKPVTCFYVAPSPSGAAFVTEWDAWREAGVRFTPLYTSAAAAPDTPLAAEGGNGASGSGTPDNDQVLSMLDAALFLHPHGLEGALGARPAEATVVLAGVSGTLASSIANELCFKGMARERLLFCDFF